MTRLHEMTTITHRFMLLLTFSGQMVAKYEFRRWWRVGIETVVM